MQVVNEPGADEVILTRSYGNERSVRRSPASTCAQLTDGTPLYSIRLIFSISDLDAVPEADEYDPEAAPPVEEDGEHGPTEESFPVETAITITKPGVDGALTIDAVAQGESWEGRPRGANELMNVGRCRWSLHDSEHQLLPGCWTCSWTERRG